MAIVSLRMPGFAWALQECSGVMKSVCGSAVGLNSALTWCVYGKVFDTGLSNRLRIELHKLHDLERHAHFDRKAERFGFGSGECIIMCPVSTC